MDDLIKRQDAIDALRDAENHAFNSYYRGLKKAHKIIADLPPAQQWIPCSERLPEKEGQYLVTLDFEWGKEIEMGDWFIFEDGHGEWVNPNSHVTVAWMPLPKPWEGEK